MSPARTAQSPGLAAIVATRRIWLFDLDGTLVDSAATHAEAYREAMAQVAPGLLGSFRYGAVAGSSTREVAATLGVDADTAQRLVRRKQLLYRGHVDAGRVPTFPAVHRLLDLLARRRRAAYLVTSGSRASVDRVLVAARLIGRFHGELTADDMPWSKPDPRVYREACRRWGVDPGDAVVLEDSAAGVRSAVHAGMAALHVHTTRAAPGALAVARLGTLVTLLGGKPTGDD